jgi:hypothetical protein
MDRVCAACRRYAIGLAWGYLQSIYNDPMQSTAVSMRAAAIAIEYERPALKAQAIILGGSDFASRLERAVERSRQAPRIVEAEPIGRSGGSSRQIFWIWLIDRRSRIEDTEDDPGNHLQRRSLVDRRL